MLERVWRKGNPPTLSVGVNVGPAIAESSMEVPSKTKNRTTIWPSNPTPGHISRESHNLKRYMYPRIFIAAPFTITRTWKQPKCPWTEEGIKEMWYRYTMKYYTAIKKNKIMPFAGTGMSLEIVLLSRVSHTQKDQHHDITYLCNLKRIKGTNELIYKTEVESWM